MWVCLLTKFYLHKGTLAAEKKKKSEHPGVDGVWGSSMTILSVTFSENNCPDFLEKDLAGATRMAVTDHGVTLFEGRAWATLAGQVHG